MSTRITAFGIQIQLGDGGGTEVFTTIAGVMSASGFGATQTAIETTAHDSPGGWATVTGGLKKGDTVSLTVAYDPVEGTHDATTGLKSLFTAGVPRNFKVIYPDTATSTEPFGALLTQFSVTGEIDGLLTAAITLEGSGATTLV